MQLSTGQALSLCKLAGVYWGHADLFHKICKCFTLLKTDGEPNTPSYRDIHGLGRGASGETHAMGQEGTCQHPVWLPKC